MRPETIINEDIEDVSGSLKGRKAGFSSKLSAVFRLLSDMYSDPFGTMSQELASNGLDAHTAASKRIINYEPRPIKVGFGEDDNGYDYVFYKDFGLGMDENFMDKVYMDYGESTKWEDDDELGMFGIGSKSGFSKFEQYHIISVCNGVRYHFLMFEGDDGIPEYNTLHKKETNELSGTEIRLYRNDLRDHEEDRIYDFYDFKNKFEKGFNNQLFYFNEIYFADSISNNFNVYEFGTFLYRKKIDRHTSIADLCLKRIRYEINYRKIGLDTFYSPIGLKFHQTDLRVVPNRESVRYERREINRIIYKIKSACYEIINRYNDNDNFIVDDISEYYIKSELNKDPIFKHKTYDIVLDVKYHSDYLKRQFNIDYPHNKYKLKFLEDVDIANYNNNTIITLFSLLFEVVAEIKNGRLYRKEKGIVHYNNNLINNLLTDSGKLFTVKSIDFESDSIKNKYISNGYIVAPRKHVKIKFYRYLISSLFVKEGNRVKYRNKVAKLLFKYFNKTFLEKTYSYSQLEVPEEVIESLTARSSRTVSDKFIFEVPNSFYEYTYKNYNYRRYSQYKHILDKVNDYNFEDFKKNYTSNKDYNNYYRNKFIYSHNKDLIEALAHLKIFRISSYRLLRTSKKNYNILKEENLKNFMSEEEFFKHKMFRNVCTAFFLQKVIIDDNKKGHVYANKDLPMKIFSEINPNLFERYEKIVNFIQRYTKINSGFDSKNETFQEFMSQCISIAENNNVLDKDSVSDLMEIKDYFSDIDLICYLNQDKFNTIKDYSYLADYLKYKFKKVNKKYYSVLTFEWELELVQESFIKTNYLNTINHG